MTDDGQKQYPLLEAFRQVVDFHEKFDLHNNMGARLPASYDEVQQAGRFITGDELRELRINLLQEEVQEYLDGEYNDSLADIADGLADIIVIVLGTAASYGIPIHAVFAEVMRTNFAKLDENGKPRYRNDGKLLKPEGWVGPKITPIFDKFEGGLLIEARQRQSSQNENPDQSSQK